MRERLQPMDWVLAIPAVLVIAVSVVLLKLHIISADRAYVWLHPEDWRTPVEGPQPAPERRAHAAQEQAAGR